MPYMHGHHVLFNGLGLNGRAVPGGLRMVQALFQLDGAGMEGWGGGERARHEKCTRGRRELQAKDDRHVGKCLTPLGSARTPSTRASASAATPRASSASCSAALTRSRSAPKACSVEKSSALEPQPAHTRAHSATSRGTNVRDVGSDHGKPVGLPAHLSRS
jgi:hypothetical protein